MAISIEKELEKADKIHNLVTKQTKTLKSVTEIKKRELSLLHNSNEQDKKLIESKYGYINDLKETKDDNLKKLNEIKNYLHNISLTKRDVLVKTILDGLNKNTNKNWKYIETNIFGELDIILYDVSYDYPQFVPANVGLFTYEPEMLAINQVPEEYIINNLCVLDYLNKLANEGKVITLYVDPEQPNQIPIFEKKEKVAGRALYFDPDLSIKVNNKFYMDKYPFFRDILINLMKNKVQ